MKKNLILFFIFPFLICLSNFFPVYKINAANESIVCPGLKMFKNWCAGEHMQDNNKVCLIVARPINSKGNYKKRGMTTATVYRLPAQDNQNIFYITAGYQYKNESFVTINVDGKDKFELKLIENDAAWTDDDSVDKDIIEALKKGIRMTVIGYSSRGTKTTDMYSLSGFTAAYKHIVQNCDISQIE